MTLDEWLGVVGTAFDEAGTRPANALATLRTPVNTKAPNAMTPEQNRLGQETIDALVRLIFRRAVRGEAFGDQARVRETFGKSLEENYGLSAGPFINLARAYWTFKLEAQDFIISHLGETQVPLLAPVLTRAETKIGSVFFPTPGRPVRVPVEQRRQAQRQLLQQYAPELDVDRLLNENPILRAEAQVAQRGCMIIVLIGAGLLIGAISAYAIIGASP